MQSLLALLQQLDWRQAFDAGALRRGEEYAQQRRVSLQSTHDGLIRASCRGSAGQHYQQQILLGSPSGPVVGRCSCPVGFNCKHCVAVLLHLLQQTAPMPAMPATRPDGLPGTLKRWLDELPEVLQGAANDYPRGESSRLYYRLLPDLAVELFKVRLRKDGTLGEAKPYSAWRDAIGREPRFLLPLDLRIARLACSTPENRHGYGHRLDLEGSSGGELLDLLLQTNRLFLELDAPLPLCRGEPRPAHFVWQTLRDGHYRPNWQIDDGSQAELLTAIEPLHYLDVDAGLIGELQHELPTRLVRHLSQLPSIGASVAELFSLELQQLAPQLPLPKAPHERLVEDLQPVARLTLGSHLHSGYDPRSGRMVVTNQHRAGLVFDYAGALIHGKPGKDTRLRQRVGDEYLSIVRQAKAEQALRRRLEQFGFSPALRQSQALAEGSAEMFELADDNQWLHFVQQQLTALRAEGWQIEIRPGFHFDLSPVETWYADLDEAPAGDWFDLELGIVVDGQRISLLPVLLKLIRQQPQLLSPAGLALRGDDEVLRLQLDERRTADGRPLQVLLPFGRLKPVLATLAELYLRDQSPSAALRLSAPDAARLSQLEELPLEWQGGERLRDFARRLRDCQRTPALAPPGLRAELRPYQLEGLGWMQTLRELQAGGVLGDDMGLGKTLQSLAHLLTEKHAGRLDRPALAVMPTSLIPNWQDEAARFTPELRVLALHGPHRQPDFARLGDFDLLLTTYALLPRDLEQWRQQPLHVLILDEAQYIKNPASKAAQAARQLEARQRLCLSGTPMENHLGELWSLFHFLMPGWLGDSRRFTRDYRTPIEKHADSARLAHLNARIKPFLLRRKKDQVARELPAKSEIIHWVELSEAQRDLYESVRLAMDKKVREAIQRKGLARSQIVILEALLKLRQVCCDLRLVKSGTDSRKAGSHSGKLDGLLEMLAELLEEGRRVLLFSQFTSMLALIEAELQQRSIPYALLTGETIDRRSPVQQFQSGQVPLFLISLKAGGTGLNLTAADTVIHFDPWWNPAAENQATDRAYRIGQDKPVFVYKLIARGTVEEKIQQLQQRKAALAAGVLESAGQGDWQLQPDDLDALFAPLPVS